MKLASVHILRPQADTARTAATACLRRARSRSGTTQAELADRLGTCERVVRRRESGKADLGVLESALRDPRFALALAEELRAKAEELLQSEIRRAA